MNALLWAAAAAAVFAAAAAAGARTAAELCADRAPYPGGPAPVAVHPAVIALAGAAAGAAFALRGAQATELLMLVAIVFALAGCAAADFACGALPDPLTLGPLALVVGVGLAARDLAPLAGAAFLFAGFAAGALVTRGHGMGWGDVKLAALGGALLGAGAATAATLLAAVAALVVARRSGVRTVAFGPYLAASFVFTLSLVRTF
ncbi:MAG TPA: prepilin peptidase [Candidatus Elarobacter sp.]|jgi:prepilin signal peptidase PulO-like enzyme (type II secretory pathway)